MPYGVILVVFMGSGLGLRSFGVDGSIRRTLGRPVWDFGHPLGPPHTLQADPGGIYGVRVGSGDTWGHPMPYGVVLGVFMGSGLGLGTPGVIPCPMGWSWGCLWGQGWVWGHLGLSHALWDGPGGIYGVRVGFGDTWGHPRPYGVILGVFMGSGLGLWSFGINGRIRTFGRSVWDFGHPLGHVRPPHTLQADPGGIYGVWVGFGDVWGHLMPCGVVLGVFMGSGLGLGTPGVIPCPMGWSWGCLWGQGWVWGYLGSSHALWGDPGGIYGVRVGFVVFWDRWKDQNFRKACMGFWPSFGTSGAMWGHPTPSRPTLVVFMGSGLGLVTPGVIPCPMGWSWGCLWGQGWVWGHLGSSHALWGGPGGVYGVRVGSS
ncbi:uncharacterized protein LOC121108710 [Gallus gallus]|uniref:uncharacterized protein LOC121108710 n=1 Tax=Gallus gallus TaxID=9031 RepID=UPI001AE5FD5E|nr:uncharacterized protein LOC121108710 [Gallus gallus]